VVEKAAALFHSLIANHPFHNGNKRTAVLAFDIFLAANGYFGLIANEEMYRLAERTASYKERGLSHDESLREILDAVTDGVVRLSAVRDAGKGNADIAKLYDSVKRARGRIRRDKNNTRIPSS